MYEMLKNSWWKYLLRGLIAIVFGVVAMIKPDQALQGMVLAFGAFALMDGTLAVFAGISLAPIFNRWWAVLLEGVAGVIIGLVTFFYPNITALVLFYLISVWAIVTGILEIVTAIQLRRVITGEWKLILSGLLSIVFGVLMFVYPAAGAVSVVWTVGFYAIAFGILEISLAFHMHSLSRDIKKIDETEMFSQQNNAVS